MNARIPIPPALAAKYSADPKPVDTGGVEGGGDLWATGFGVVDTALNWFTMNYRTTDEEDAALAKARQILATEKPTDSINQVDCDTCDNTRFVYGKDAHAYKVEPVSDDLGGGENVTGPTINYVGHNRDGDWLASELNAAYLAGQESTGDELASLTNQLAEARVAQPEGDERNGEQQ